MGYVDVKGRELALQALYQIEITGDASAAAVELFLSHFEGSADAKEFPGRLVSGVVSQAVAIDLPLRSLGYCNCCARHNECQKIRATNKLAISKNTPLIKVGESSVPKRLPISMASSKLTFKGMSGQKTSS